IPAVIDRRYSTSNCTSTEKVRPSMLFQRRISYNGRLCQVTAAPQPAVAKFQKASMHIPDGYLSPSTCAALYGASAPFWYTALQRVKARLATRLVPLLSVMAALSFVVMMFNLPLPGGTTGHAVGVAIATIILGPWAS